VSLEPLESSSKDSVDSKTPDVTCLSSREYARGEAQTCLHVMRFLRAEFALFRYHNTVFLLSALVPKIFVFFSSFPCKHVAMPRAPVNRAKADAEKSCRSRQVSRLDPYAETIMPGCSACVSAGELCRISPFNRRCLRCVRSNNAKCNVRLNDKECWFPWFASFRFHSC